MLLQNYQAVDIDIKYNGVSLDAPSMAGAFWASAETTTATTTSRPRSTVWSGAGAGAADHVSAVGTGRCCPPLIDTHFEPSFLELYGIL